MLCIAWYRSDVDSVPVGLEGKWIFLFSLETLRNTGSPESCSQPYWDHKEGNFRGGCGNGRLELDEAGRKQEGKRIDKWVLDMNI